MPLHDGIADKEICEHCLRERSTVRQEMGLTMGKSAKKTPLMYVILTCLGMCPYVLQVSI